MDLKEYLASNWSKGDFIRISLNSELREKIENQTKFLNKYYEEIPLRIRAYAIVNEINEGNIPRCKCGCGKVSALNKSNSALGFREYSGPECSRKSKTIDSNTLKILDEYDFLYKEKIENQKSIEQIASELKISTCPVVKYLKKHNLYQLNDARKLSIEKEVILNNYELMYDYYVKQDLTLRDIAKIINCGTSTVIKFLTKHNIDIKNANSYERKFKKISNEEMEVFNYIKSLETSNIIQSDRKILNGKEIDILIPTKNIGIEYNGIYSHLFRENADKKCLTKDKNYHLSKTIIARKNGVNLFQFYSSEWNYEKEMVQNFIKRKLHLNKVIEVSDINCLITEKTELNKITLNLSVNSINLAKLEFINHKNFILIIKYDVDPNITLKNGLIKFLKYIKKNYNKTIYSKIDRRFGEGMLFTSYGFKIAKVIEPKILYTDNSYDKLFNTKIPNKTNYKIYNCGYLILKY